MKKMNDEGRKIDDVKTMVAGFKGETGSWLINHPSYIFHPSSCYHFWDTQVSEFSRSCL
jgi:hypothetical protein